MRRVMSVLTVIAGLVQRSDDNTAANDLTDDLGRELRQFLRDTTL